MTISTDRGTVRGRARSRPSDLDAHLGFWMRFVSSHVSGEFRKLVEANGVSVSEWVALRHLYEDDATTATALVDALGMTKGAVSKVLARLEAKGLVQRRWLDSDRRAQATGLTQTGRELVPILAALADANDARFFGHLSQTQSRQLVELLKDIVARHDLRRIPLE